MAKPKVLFFDIETSLLEAHIWGLGQQYISKEQLIKDWHMMSWSAKWLGTSDVMYMDQRNAKVLENDKKIVRALWELLDAADVVVSQNGKKFDQPRVNARFKIHEFTPPSSYKHIDTCQIAARTFGFTSNSLAFLSEALDLKHKKLKHGKFPGNELWKECAKGNREAWREMERYNRNDVLALEDLYKKLLPWDSSNVLSHFHDVPTCSCGSTQFQKRGYHVTVTGKFQRYQCAECGAWTRDRQNLLPPETRKQRRVGVPS